MEMKYVRFKKAGFFIFPGTGGVWHSHVAGFLSSRGFKLLSAGFIKFREDGPECGGYSDSIGIGCDEDNDTNDLQQLFAECGWSNSSPKIELSEEEKKEIAKEYLKKISAIDLFSLLQSLQKEEIDTDNSEAPSTENVPYLI